jgi:hypothetical protein
MFPGIEKDPGHEYWNMSLQQKILYSLEELASRYKNRGCSEHLSDYMYNKEKVYKVPELCWQIIAALERRREKILQLEEDCFGVGAIPMYNTKKMGCTWDDCFLAHYSRKIQNSSGCPFTDCHGCLDY